MLIPKKLKEATLENCKFRGHTMSRFERMNNNHSFSTCVKCGCEVVVNTLPMPNQIDISGTAIAINCTDKQSYLNRF